MEAHQAEPEHRHPSYYQKMHQDTFKGSLLGCSENLSDTPLAIVCTINVSIEYNGFDVSNRNERENIHKGKSRQIDAWFVFVC